MDPGEFYETSFSYIDMFRILFTLRIDVTMSV